MKILALMMVLWVVGLFWREAKKTRYKKRIAPIFEGKTHEEKSEVY